jgi:hypothetical protein
MRIPKLAAECGLTEQYEDVKITPSDGYVDGEWYGHQGVQVIEWPPLENCLTIDAEACNELRAVFHMLGEQAVPAPAAVERVWKDGKLVWPNGARVYGVDYEPPKALEVPASIHIRAWSMDADDMEKYGGWRGSDVSHPTRESCRDKFNNVLNFGAQPQAESATQPSEPQVRSRSEPAKSPLNGLLTEQSGRYCGLGFNGEE